MRVEASDQDSVVENFCLLLSRRSAARALDISVRMIDYAIAAGLIESRRINSRILIPAESLAKFAASDQVVPRAPAQGENLGSLFGLLFGSPARTRATASRAVPPLRDRPSLAASKVRNLVM